MTETSGIARLLRDESLEQFLAAMRDFNQAFVDALASGVDFTIKLEVRGNCGELLHAKIDDQSWRRPRGVEKRVEDRQKRGQVFGKSAR